jgi:4'-phosphopantetheinyl transferase
MVEGSPPARPVFRSKPVWHYHLVAMGGSAISHAGRRDPDRTRAPGAPESLAADTLHVWVASLDRPVAAVDQLRQLLASDERRRSDRFRFELDRARFIVGRGLLRILLGRYLAMAPSDVRFEYGVNDKPLLAHPGPWFNLSHSGPLALYAITEIGEVGVDVERLGGPDLGRERIAERFFSQAEVAALRALPVRVQANAFLACWTRKEAFIKARGDGLSLPLDSFDVSLKPGQHAAVLRTAWSRHEPKAWSLNDLSDPDGGYIAAAAVRSSRSPRVIRRRMLENTDDETMTEQEEHT